MLYKASLRKSVQVNQTMMEHLQLDASRTIDVGEIELHNIQIEDPEVIRERLSALSKQQEMYPKASVNVNGRFSFNQKP